MFAHASGRSSFRLPRWMRSIRTACADSVAAGPHRHAPAVRRPILLKAKLKPVADCEANPPRLCSLVDLPMTIRGVSHLTSTSLESQMSPAWMAVATRELGVAQFPAGQSNPRITEYHAGTNIRGCDDKASWCSSFVNWCLAQVGIAGTGSALARSWLQWGQPLEQPIPGCIVVLYRDDPQSWKGHVGFYLRHDEQHVCLLGGNQLGEVREHPYPMESVLSYRWTGPVSCDPCASSPTLESSVL